MGEKHHITNSLALLFHCHSLPHPRFLSAVCCWFQPKLETRFKKSPKLLPLPKKKKTVILQVTFPAGQTCQCQLQIWRVKDRAGKHQSGQVTRRFSAVSLLPSVTSTVSSEINKKHLKPVKLSCCSDSQIRLRLKKKLINTLTLHSAYHICPKDEAGGHGGQTESFTNLSRSSIIFSPADSSMGARV